MLHEGVAVWPCDTAAFRTPVPSMAADLGVDTPSATIAGSPGLMAAQPSMHEPTRQGALGEVPVGE